MLMAVVTAIALALGLSSRYGNLDIPITLFLLLLSGIAFALGKHLTARPLRWPPSRTVRPVIYGVGVVLSLGAVVHVIVAN
jgi:4-amino-4-deoxy-L-arabinose transferase-like glycosyltransferase